MRFMTTNAFVVITAMPFEQRDTCLAFGAILPLGKSQQAYTFAVLSIIFRYFVIDTLPAPRYNMLVIILWVGISQPVVMPS